MGPGPSDFPRAGEGRRGWAETTGRREEEARTRRSCGFKPSLQPFHLPSLSSCDLARPPRTERSLSHSLDSALKARGSGAPGLQGSHFGSLITVPPMNLPFQPRFTAQAFASSPRWLHIPSPDIESGLVSVSPNSENHEVWPEPRHYASLPSSQAPLDSQPHGPQPSQGALGQATRDPTYSRPTCGVSRPQMPLHTSLTNNSTSQIPTHF